MLKFNRPAAVALACASAVALSGCALLGGGGAKGETAYVAKDVSSLYGAAKRIMDTGDYERAAKLFDEVERQHP